MSSIQAHRNFYANFVVKSVGSSAQNLIAAFTSVERERFVGAGPWSISRRQAGLKGIDLNARQPARLENVVPRVRALRPEDIAQVSERAMGTLLYFDPGKLA
jgi:hypothetical protein